MNQTLLSVDLQS